MRLSVISFTGQGNDWNRKLNQYFQSRGYDCQGYTAQKYGKDKTPEGLLPLEASLGEWAKEQFSRSDGLVFIGAAGIAVRAVAPCLQDKFKDPAVVVMDEQADFVIPLLSGHVGGANELAEEIAAETGAVPVITTATDVNRKFAVDLFAKKHHLTIADRVLAKEVSAAILKGEPVGFFSDFPVEGQIPEGLEPGNGFFSWKRAIWITCRARAGEDSVLRLIPRQLVIGIGCRKGTPKERIARQVEEVFSRFELDLRAAAAIASIDLKQEEPGLLEYAKELGVPFDTYPADVLEQVEGQFSESAFVASVAGIGNVCERAAVAAASQMGAGYVTLLVKKQAGNGVTVAVAQKDRKVVMTE